MDLGRNKRPAFRQRDIGARARRHALAQLQPTISVGLVLEAAGYKPEVAKALADYSDQDGQSAGPAIAATAQQFGVTPEQLMEHLNRMDPDKVHDLVEQAWTVNADDKGQFPLTAPNDRNVWAPPGKDPQYGGSYLYDPQDKQFRGEYVPGGGGFPARIEDPNPHSMTALRDYARVPFGEPVLG